MVGKKWVFGSLFAAITVIATAASPARAEDHRWSLGRPQWQPPAHAGWANNDRNWRDRNERGNSNGAMSAATPGGGASRNSAGGSIAKPSGSASTIGGAISAAGGIEARRYAGRTPAPEQAALAPALAPRLGSRAST